MLWFTIHVYSLRAPSKPLEGGFVLDSRLFRRGCIMQAKAKEVLSTKSFNLKYHRPILYHLQRLLAVSPMCCTSLSIAVGHICVSVSKLPKAQNLLWFPSPERSRPGQAIIVNFLGFWILRGAGSHDEPAFLIQGYNRPSPLCLK